MLNTEFRYFIDHQDELVKKYNNRVLVIIGENVVADYDNYDQAFFQSIEKYKQGSFLLQECTEGEDAYTDTFCSPVFS